MCSSTTCTITTCKIFATAPDVTTKIERQPKLNKFIGRPKLNVALQNFQKNLQIHAKYKNLQHVQLQQLYAYAKYARILQAFKICSKYALKS